MARRRDHVRAIFSVRPTALAATPLRFSFTSTTEDPDLEDVFLALTYCAAA
jgi:hypothetical protein